jgi:hypothetical protein
MNEQQMIEPATTEAKPAVKLIYANTYQLDQLDDPTYPFTLEVVLRPPSFMSVAFAFLVGGSERAVVLGMSVEDLLDWAKKSDNLAHHPRLIRISITNRNGDVILSKKRQEPWTPVLDDFSVSERLRKDLLPTDGPLFGDSIA